VTDTPVALDFLERWLPGGPWVLTAISTDRKKLHTATFTKRGPAGQWVHELNGKLNIYFHVNPCLRPLTKKAQREDIAALAWLHVDIDPRVGEDIEEERARALRLLQEPPQGVPKPTVIIFSGGGYQGFWKLTEPLPIDGEEEKYEDAKRYNQQLEVLFGADNCHNVDRIMRLPGTLNIPDKKKLAKGRTKTLATLVEFNDNAYPLSDFTPAAPVQTIGDPTFGPTVAPISGNVPRLGSVDELSQWDVPDRVKVIIVQGSHPDEGPKEGDNSRSAWLFDVCCNLARCDVPDEVMYSVITDPDFGISASVLEASNSEKYALKQIGSAKEFAVDPQLAEMNERYAVIANYGGKCRVVEEIVDVSLNRSSLTVQAFSDFRNRYMNKHVDIGTDSKGNPRTVPQGDWWLKQPKRRQYDRIVFSPAREIPGAYNLWKGFACDARPGDCSLFLKHIHQVICGGVDEYYDYLMGWMARLMQKPDSPGQVAVVLRGDIGTGKGFFVNQLGSLLGRHYLQISDPKHLVGSFNAHLRDCLLLFGDEAFYAGDKKHESVLKTLITEDLLTIEKKGIDAETAANLTHIILASNSRWVVPAGASERRFLVLDVASDHQQDSRYFGAIAKQMREGGREALLHLLLTHDISDYEVRSVPKTAALDEQKVLSMAPEEEWWYSKLQDGILLPSADDGGWPENVLKTELLDDFVERMREYNVARRGNPTVLGQFLRRICPGIRSWQGRRGGQRPYFFAIPALDKSRVQWEKRFGSVVWAVVEQREEELPEVDPF
jgi:hypothetical protein